MSDLDLYMSGDDMMGRRRRYAGRGRTRRPRRGGRSVRRRLLKQAAAGGAQRNPIGKYNLGLPIQTFTDTALGPLQAKSNPQKPFKPMRLVITVVRSPAGVGGLISITQASVGVDPVLVTTDPIAVDAYSAAASNGNDNIAWPEASKGLDVTVAYANTVAVGVGEQVDVATTFWGPTAT